MGNFSSTPLVQDAMRGIQPPQFPMAKLTLNSITTGYRAPTALNVNFDLIEAAMENTLSRDGTTPNQMSADIDMNGFRILNQGNAITIDGFNWLGTWVTATAYAVGDVVERSGSAYVCIVAHTSGTFSTDLSAAKWQLVASASLPSQTGNNGKLLSTDGSTAAWVGAPLAISYGGTGATSAADVRTALSLGTMALEAKTITTKGDVLVGGSAGALARQPIGTDTYVLTADSAEANGVKWAAPTSFTAATQAEQEAGSSTTAGVTPGRQHYHPSAAKAWGLITHPTTNTTSYPSGATVTNPATGQYVVTHGLTFSSSNYAVVCTSVHSAFAACHISARTTTTFTLEVRDASGSATNPTAFSYQIFGDL